MFGSVFSVMKTIVLDRSQGEIWCLPRQEPLSFANLSLTKIIGRTNLSVWCMSRPTRGDLCKQRNPPKQIQFPTALSPAWCHGRIYTITQFTDIPPNWKISPKHFCTSIFCFHEHKLLGWQLPLSIRGNRNLLCIANYFSPLYFPLGFRHCGAFTEPHLSQSGGPHGPYCGGLIGKPREGPFNPTWPFPHTHPPCPALPTAHGPLCYRSAATQRSYSLSTVLIKCHLNVS